MENEKNKLSIKSIENPRGKEKERVKFNAEYVSDSEQPVGLIMELPYGNDYPCYLSWHEWERLAAWLSWKRAESLSKE